jgi:pectin methylesterase-like acyl-CoA thioesterase
MKSKTVLLLSAAAMALIFVAIGNAAPANFTVGCGAGSQPTIQAAVIAAGPGSKITVCPGTYTEQVTVPAGKDGLKMSPRWRSRPSSRRRRR